MNNPTDEQILAVVGSAWKKYTDKPLIDRDPQCFLDSLIPVEKVWNPSELKIGDEYWFIWADGGVNVRIYTGGEIDRWQLAINQAFPTREAAELYKAEKLKQLD